MRKEETKGRFLKAIENLIQEDPKKSDHFNICCDILDSCITNEGKLNMNLENLNKILLSCYEYTMENEVFNYFFPKGIDTIEKLEKGVEKFRKKAMFFFGNFKYPLRYLCSDDLKQFEPEIPEFKKRLDFIDIEFIPPNKTCLLGHITGLNFRMELQRKLFVKEKLKSLIENFSKNGKEGFADEYGRLNSKQKAMLEKENINEKVIQGSNPLDEMNNKIAELDEFLETRKDDIKYIDIGKKNYQRYLVIDTLDVYFATSMRKDEDFELIGNFIKRVMDDSDLEKLKLRYFDPTQAFTNDRIAKGLLEALMLKRAKVAVYYAWEDETFGKVSEASTMLVQGKPVIIYVPEFNSDEPMKNRKAEKLAETFKELHPLSLQVNINNGVANGVIVVRKESECSRMIYQLLTNTFRTEIREDEHNYLLLEKSTQSVIRVVTKDKLLTRSFWNYYLET